MSKKIDIEIDPKFNNMGSEDLESFGKFSEALSTYIEKHGPVTIDNNKVSHMGEMRYVPTMDSELMTPTVLDMFKITRRMVDLYARKNRDYGNTFDKTLDEDGLVVAKIRLADKLGRFGQLIKKDATVEDETIIDTLMDLSNYSAMTIRWIEDRENDK